MDSKKVDRIALWLTLGYSTVGVLLGIKHVFNTSQHLYYCYNPGKVLVKETEAFLGPREGSSKKSQ